MTRYQPFKIILGGRAYSATWHAEEGILHVSSAYGSTSSPLRDHERAPLVLAERLFRDLINARRSNERRSNAP